MRFVNLKNKQALFEKDERLIFKRFAKICLLSKQISMKTSLWDFSSLLEKSKVEMELSNLFRFCRHCSLCVVLSVWLCTHSFPFVSVQVREGGISSIF